MNTWNPLHHLHHLTSSSCSEEDISISTSLVTNASNHSSLTVASPHELNTGPASAASTNFLGEGPSENHPWSQVLQYMETDKSLLSDQVERENFLAALPSKHQPSETIEPPSNYLEKVDRSWDFTCLSSYNNKTEEKLNNYHDISSNNWSITQPDPDLDHQLAPATSSENQSLMSCYGQQDLGNSPSLFMRSFAGTDVGCHMGLGNSGLGHDKHQYGMPQMPWSRTRNFTDLTSYTTYLNKPYTDFQTSNEINLNLKGPLLLETRQDISSTRGSNRGAGPVNNHNGKKKKSEDTSEANSKKPKQEFPKPLSNKVHAPKARLGDRISALQQIVSPFGKTDTASVLFEAIGYIKFLQEQVQLLSSPYLKAQDHNSRGDQELSSRGLCLVPISCTPQIFREYNGPDYLTPSHRGCLYR